MGYTIHETNTLVGRVLSVGGLAYTVTSADTLGEVHVWDPRTETYLHFDSRETFEHWAYGAPVNAAANIDPIVAASQKNTDDALRLTITPELETRLCLCGVLTGGARDPRPSCPVHPTTASGWLEHAYDERCRELTALQELHESVVGTAHRLRDERDALLAACKEALDHIDGNPVEVHEAFAVLHAAIAHAEGRNPGPGSFTEAARKFLADGTDDAETF